MTNLIRAEITKLRTTALARWLLVATVVLTPLAVGGFILSAKSSGIDLSTAHGVRSPRCPIALPFTQSIC